MEETWKDIKGYEGYYQVSSLGNVRSLDRIDISGRSRKGKKHPQFEEKGGYLVVSFCKDGKAKHYRVHRLVATAFIENPLNLPEINHKDENKQNNRFDNLEWCTTGHNINYGSRNAKVSAALSGERSHTHKLTKEQVKEIQEAKGKVTRKELSSKYGVSVSQIGRILSHKEWKILNKEETP